MQSVCTFLYFVCGLFDWLYPIFFSVTDPGESVQWTKQCFASQNRSFFLLLKIEVLVGNRGEWVASCIEKNNYRCHFK